ncbi:MAG: hypothetical protein OQK71_03830, partial [Desulfobacter sp.]|nr:hypothetical protein [Desulfobacter sp.]
MSALAAALAFVALAPSLVCAGPASSGTALASALACRVSFAALAVATATGFILSFIHNITSFNVLA